MVQLYDSMPKSISINSPILISLLLLFDQCQSRCQSWFIYKNIYHIFYNIYLLHFTIFLNWKCLLIFYFDFIWWTFFYTHCLLTANALFSRESKILWNIILIRLQSLSCLKIFTDMNRIEVIQSLFYSIFLFPYYIRREVDNNIIILIDFGAVSVKYTVKRGNFTIIVILYKNLF